MDVRFEVTQKIINQLEKGVDSFRNILINSAAEGMPKNGLTGNDYKGSNVLMLWFAKEELGYKSNTWLTYKQAIELGAQVRKGEKSTLCSYFDMKEKKQADSDMEQGEGKDFYMLCKPFFLFNLDQIDNLPEHLLHKEEAKNNNKRLPEIADFLANTGADVIEEQSAKIYYDRTGDKVHIPNINKFISSENYYLALAHEITHWTGAPQRLNRTKGKRFADDAYCWEELVAELGAAMVGGHFGLLDATLEHHASYLQSWLNGLKADKNAIFAASKLAFEAYEYMVGLQYKQQEKEAA